MDLELVAVAFREDAELGLGLGHGHNIGRVASRRQRANGAENRSSVPQSGGKVRMRRDALLVRIPGRGWGCQPTLNPSKEAQWIR
jgi:hypothetical protein